MANYYQSMGNSYATQKKGRRDGYPTKIDRYVYNMRSDDSEKQRKYYNFICNFLKERGVDYHFVDRPRNRAHCISIIKALRTIIHKNGLDKEFANEISKNKELEGEF